VTLDFISHAQHILVVYAIMTSHGCDVHMEGNCTDSSISTNDTRSLTKKSEPIQTKDVTHIVPPTVTPNHPSGVYIIWSDKYNPSFGHQPLSVGRNNKFDTALQQFINGEVSYESTARAIIEVLFERDFSGDGKHWDSPCTYVSMVKRHNSGAESWDVERYSDWDWKDIYARARSHTVITMSGDRKRIRLDEYSFYCAG